MPTIMKCSEVIANCTLCADYNQCLACDDTDLLVNKFKTKLNETYIYCTSSLNYQLVNAKGDNKTNNSPARNNCNDNNCKYCQSELDSDCQRCEHGYYQDGTICTKPLVKDESYNFKEVNYFVEANENCDIPKLDENFTLNGRFSTPEQPLTHIQQVFYLITRDARYKENMNVDQDPWIVNVYLGPGNHFFYTCNLEEGSSSCDDLHCNEQLINYYQVTDNIIFNFKPLREADFDTAALEAHYANFTDAVYSSAYSSASQTEYKKLTVDAGERPTIVVMDNEAHFNITRGATFEDIIFRGDYGML